jgi:hypothetical protein
MGDAKLIRRFCFTPINGIENQLEKSNHNHLGKLITYLSALEARVAVWIVSDNTRKQSLG